jgi:hypothetical protein
MGNGAISKKENYMNLLPYPARPQPRALHYKLFIALLFVLLFVAAVRIGEVSALPANAAAQARQNQLRLQVDTATGAPRSGRDPASQSQVSLGDAASRPEGIGTRTDKPAAGVTGSAHHTMDMSGMNMPDTKTTHVLASGCVLGYGKPGEQCLPVYIAPRGVASPCAAVHKLFPKGIAVEGNDFLGLGKDASGLACKG